MTTTISRRTTLTLLFLFVASFLFGTLTVFVVQVYQTPTSVFVCCFFSRSFFSKSSSSSRFGGFVCFFCLIVAVSKTPLPFRRVVVVYVAFCLSVCRGRSRFEEGCFSRKFFFCFFFSTKTEDWRKKWVLLDDVGKNTNHFIETLFSRGAKNTNHQNVCFSTLMT